MTGIGSKWPSVAYLLECICQRSPFRLPVCGILDIPPNPVRDVQRPVGAQRKQVVGGDRLRAAGALKHEQLRQDRDALEPDAEGPQHLARVVLVGEQDAEHGRAAKQVLDAEGVLVRVVRGLVVVEHQVDDVGLRADEDNLEGRVPEGGGGVCPEEI